MKKRLVVTLVAGLLVTGSLALCGDWAQWRGPHRDGKSRETNLLKQWPAGGPRQLWAYEQLGDGYSTVSVANGVIYTTGLVGKVGFLYALDLDGKLKWKVPYGNGWDKGGYRGSRTTPTVDGSNVYTMSGHGRIACFDVADGKEKWAVETVGRSSRFKGKNISWGISESVLIDGDNVICTPGGRNATVVALNKNTGRTVWTSKGLSDRSAYCSAIRIRDGQRNLIVTAASDRIVGLNPQTGKLLWDHPMKNKYSVHPNTPIYNDGKIFVTCGYGWGCVMLNLSADGSSVTQAWKHKDLDVHHGGVILIDGCIYGTSSRGKWICKDWNSGRNLHTDRGIGKGCLTYADGMIYGYSERGMVGLIKPSRRGLKVVSSFRVTKGGRHHWAHPVVCNGRLYIRHGNALMAYDIKAQ